MSSGLLSSRPRCAEHGLILDDAGACSRCRRQADSRTTRGVLGRTLVIALFVVAALLLYRVAGVTYGLVQASATTRSATSSPAAPAQNGSRVVVYTTASCGVCRMAKRWMAEHSVAYEERHVDTDEAASAQLKGLGKGMVVPTFVVDDQVLTGFDVQGVRLTEALKSHGIQ